MTDRADAGATGVLNFLFTDIEGSSQRWESAPAEMREAVRLQDEAIERAVTANGGQVFKRVGDELCSVFLRNLPPQTQLLGLGAHHCVT